MKEWAEHLPEEIGRPLARVPFGVRLGCAYSRSVSAIERAFQTDRSEREAYAFSLLRGVVKHAYEHVHFYREFYQSKGFQPDQLRLPEDWAEVPVVGKGDLQSVPLELRVDNRLRGMKINTGGTSGQPLDFLLDQQAFAREWAHMHAIWKARGYRQKHLKLTLRGKHFDRMVPLRYNAVHNEYVVNANCPMKQVISALAALSQGTVIRWVHGYPSLVAEFAHALSADPVLASLFRERLFGVLLGSEYPAPAYRSVIEQTFSSNIVSWYGHSEMAVLARETAVGVYESLPTYGYAEAVGDQQAGGHRLICTSYYNFVHPFIRYDTGDFIAPLGQYGGSLAFRIAEGRVGDFVLDREGNKLALTSIIFGRHHEAFSELKHLQVKQEAPGYLTFLVVPRATAVDASVLARGFDFSGLSIDWKIEVMREPIRTAAGKIRLKV